MVAKYRFNRMELAGSLGDLGALLPLAIGMIMVNGMSVTGVFFTIGMFYVCAGLYFGVPVPVQPMKAISAYAIATGMTAIQISASAGMVSLFLLVIGLTGAIDTIGRLIPKAVIRGIQLSTGVLLMNQGLAMIVGKSPYQLAQNAIEPYLSLQTIGPLPISIVLGIIGSLVTLFFLSSKKYPAGLLVILIGIVAGLLLGKREGLQALQAGLYLPDILPFGLPGNADMVTALFVLVLPQLPMTVGNAVVANTNLSGEYFGDDSRKVTYVSTTLSMAVANGFSFFLGGIPLCHGAGGLAAHYSFGARTGGSNLIIGTLFLALALFFGSHALALINLLPMSILGVLLIFAGSQLGLSILDMFARKDMFLVLIILCVTLTTNLAWGFLLGTAVAYLFQIKRLSI